MTDKPTRGQHLYVFQDATGRIKIGRSGDPAKRRRSMQTATGRKIITILVLKDRGFEELAIMTKLAKHRRLGEWFNNTDECRLDITDAIGGPIDWPMPSEKYIQAWRKKKEEEEIRAMVAIGIAKIYASSPKRKRSDLVERRIEDARKAAEASA